MAKIEEIIDSLLKKPIAHHMCDSGGAYGYIYERNQNEGYLKGLNPVDEYTNEEMKERELNITIPVYDFLTYNLKRDEAAISAEKRLFNELEIEAINYFSIWEVKEVIERLFEKGLLPFDWINTYNSEQFVSQTLQFFPFQNENEDDFILLQIHNGCDVRSGYTPPMVFSVKDIEYFWLGLSDTFCQCDCGLNDYCKCGSDDLTDNNGNYVGNGEVYERTYLDENGNVCCKECNSVVKGGFVQW